MAHTLSADTLADDVEVEAGKDKLMICTNRFKKGNGMLAAYLFSLIM
jgi:hypothetical protein